MYSDFRKTNSKRGCTKETVHPRLFLDTPFKPPLSPPFEKEGNVE